MHTLGRYVQWEHQLSVLIGIVVAAVVAYVPIDRGSVVADIPEILVPLVIAFGLLLLTVHLRHRRLAPEQNEHIVKFGWIGALTAVVIGGWWITLHLLREVPVARLSDQIVTIWSLGVGAGVLVGIYTVRRRSLERRATRRQVLAETTWTSRSHPNPILEAIVEAIAEVDGDDPLELDSPLYEFVDPDVLTDLRTHEGSQWQLQFYTDDYEIRVGSHGTVTIFDARPLVV